jgi:hypothetical protein
MRIKWLIVAAAALAVIGIVATLVPGGHWWSFAIPFVLASLLLAAARRQRDEGRTRR